MQTRLFIRNFPMETTKEQIHELFSMYGEVVNVQLTADGHVRQSEGCGYVKMANRADAQEAIKNLNGSTIGKRQIMVAMARPIEYRYPGNGLSRNGKGILRNWLN